MFSGNGVNRLRDFFNQAAIAYHPEFEEGTMFDDAEELDEEEGQMTGLMHATVLDDDDTTTTAPQGVPAPNQT